jgi:hypothetical protein
MVINDMSLAMDAHRQRPLEGQVLLLKRYGAGRHLGIPRGDAE